MSPQDEKPSENPPLVDDAEDYVPRVARPDEPIVFGSPVLEASNKAMAEALSVDLHPQEAMAAKLRAIAHMSALSYKTKDIARVMGMQEARVSTYRNLPDVKALARRLTTELFLSNPEARFRNMAPKAASVIYSVMCDKEERGQTRLAAAAEILDRAYGKATQKLEHSGSMVRELLDKLDKEAKILPGEVTDVEVIPGDSVCATVPEPPEPLKEEGASMPHSNNVTDSPNKVQVDESGKRIDEWVKKNVG